MKRDGIQRTTWELLAAVAILLTLPVGARADVRADGLAALGRGLDWLVAQQNENGSFGMLPNAPQPGEVGITGLAIKAIADAPADLGARHRAALDRAVAWLLTNQREDGSFTTERAGLDTYRTSIGIMALVAVDPDRYRAEIVRARDLIASLQFSEERGLEGVPDPRQSPHYGGWGYDRAGVQPDADLSNVQFALQALRAAGLPDSSPVYRRVAVFLSRCQNLSETNDLASLGVVADITVGNDGGFMYDPGLSRTMSPVETVSEGQVRVGSYGSMTYAGLLSMLHANLSRSDPRVQAAFGWIRRHYTLDENHGLGTHDDPQSGQQGLYYYFLTLARALDAFGAPRIETETEGTVAWAADLVSRLADLQHPEGFWVNTNERWWEVDPTLVTCYVTQALEIALRNLPEGPPPPPANVPLAFAIEELQAATLCVVHRVGPEGRGNVQIRDRQAIRSLTDLLDPTLVNPPGAETRYLMVFALPDGRTAQIAVYPGGWNFQGRAPANAARRDPDGRLYERLRGLFR